VTSKVRDVDQLQFSTVSKCAIGLLNQYTRGRHDPSEKKTNARLLFSVRFVVKR